MKPTHALLGLSFASLLWGSALREEGPWSLPLTDASRIVGPEECAECHAEEFDVWKASAHEAGSKVLTRDPRTREIARALGLRRVTNDPRCTSCHFTFQAEGQEGEGSETLVAGVSCESCHGEAREWMALHDDFGGPGVTLQEETPEHRAARLASCDEAGMRRPDRLDQMAARCLACHLIADRELVEVGGHPDGSTFEFSSWSLGEVRHYFVRGAGENVQATPAHRRLLWLVGQLELLAGLLDAVEDPEVGLGPGLMERAERARAALVEAASAAPVRPLAELATPLGYAVPADEVGRLVLARKLRAAATELVALDGEVDLAGLDPFLPADAR